MDDATYRAFENGLLSARRSFRHALQSARLASAKAQQPDASLSDLAACIIALDACDDALIRLSALERVISGETFQ